MVNVNGYIPVAYGPQTSSFLLLIAVLYLVIKDHIQNWQIPPSVVEMPKIYLRISVYLAD